jgi:hypothetical protein
MLLVGIHLAERDFDMRLIEARFGYHLWQKFIYRAADETNAYRTDITFGKALRRDCCLLRTLKHGLRFNEKGATHRCKRNASGTAREQLYAQRMLKQLNLPAKRRLSHIETFRRTPKIQLCGDGRETTKLSEIKH